MAATGIASAQQLSTLSGITVHALPRGAAEALLVFSGPVPAKWTAEGNGSSRIVVHLPGAQARASTQQVLQGVNSIARVSALKIDGGVDVTLDLTAPGAVRFAQSPSTIVVIAPSSAAVSPGARQAPATQQTPSQSAKASGAKSKVVFLKYADVSEVAGILSQGAHVAPQDVFVPSGSIFTLPTQANGYVMNASPQAVNTPPSTESFGERVDDHIAVDRRLNAIVLIGTTAEIEGMEALVQQLDVPVQSVMLDCKVVELSRTSSADLGLDFTSGPGGPIGQGSATISTTNGQANGTGVNTPIFIANFAAKLFATIAHGGGKILASPRVLSQNGVPAQILTGDALPIISTTVFPGPPVTTQTTVSYICSAPRP